MFFRFSLFTTALILTSSCIDDCSCRGASKSPAGKPPNQFALQNILKNNFLAPAGNPKLINQQGVLSGGESVNCNRLGCANNDIHIDISARPRKADESEEARLLDDGAVAEISPRHRPASWELFDSPDYRSFFRTHPAMFTGQLFYDASHKPRLEPPRASVWEVHPVYAIHVCLKTSLSDCRPELVNDLAVWIPFDQLQKHLRLRQMRKTMVCEKAP